MDLLNKLLTSPEQEEASRKLIIVGNVFGALMALKALAFNFNFYGYIMGYYKTYQTWN